MSEPKRPRGDHEYIENPETGWCQQCGHPDRSPIHVGMEDNYADGYRLRLGPGLYDTVPPSEPEPEE